MFKKLLFKFLKRFYNPNLTYINPEIKGFVDKAVPFTIDILINGFIGYFFLLGLILIFNVPGINLGTEYWHIALIIPLLGVMQSFIAHWYKFFKGGKK